MMKSGCFSLTIFLVKRTGEKYGCLYSPLSFKNKMQLGRTILNRKTVRKLLGPSDQTTGSLILTSKILFFNAVLVSPDQMKG